jgi:hypothetical protein
VDNQMLLLPSQTQRTKHPAAMSFPAVLNSPAAEHFRDSSCCYLLLLLLRALHLLSEH